MSIINIQTALYNIIDGIKVAAGISAVYKYPLTDVSITPSVMVLLTDSSEEFHSTGQNSLNANFVIRIIVEKATDDSAQNTTLLTIVDAILDALRLKTNQYLSCNAYSVLSTGISPVQVDKLGNTYVFYVDISVETRAFKTI